MTGRMAKCPVDGCKSYFVCREDWEEHMSQQHGHQTCRGVTRTQPDGREDIQSAACAGTVTDTRRTNATTPVRGATSAESDASTAGCTSIIGNTGSQVFVGRSPTSKTGQSKSGVVSVTGNKGSQIFCGSSGSFSASGARPSTSGDFTVIGNKGIQLCVTPTLSSSTYGGHQNQSGFIVIRDNQNMQMLSDGSREGNVNVCGNVDAQLYHGVATSGAAANNVNVKDNEKSVVFIPQLGGAEAASEIQTDVAEGALDSVTPEFAQD